MMFPIQKITTRAGPTNYISPIPLKISAADEQPRARIHELLQGTAEPIFWQKDHRPRLDQLAEIAELTIIQKRDPVADHHCSYNCLTHAFKVLRCGIPEGIMGNSVEALIKSGYVCSTSPIEPGGIVYGHMKDGALIPQHFGIVRGSRIESKFDCGHIIEHPTSLVYPPWGDHIVYFYNPADLRT